MQNINENVVTFLSRVAYRLRRSLILTVQNIFHRNLPMRKIILGARPTSAAIFSNAAICCYAVADAEYRNAISIGVVQRSDF